MQYASQNLIPVTLELGGKSPNIFFESVMDADDEFFDKCLEGATLFAVESRRGLHVPVASSCSGIDRDKFIPRFVERTKAIKMGHPLDPSTMMGAQASQDQYEKILNYLQIGKDEGAEVLTGRQGLQEPGRRGWLLHRADHNEGPQQDAGLPGRDLRPGHMRHDLPDEAEAIEIANDTLYGLGAGVWTRDAHELYRVPRAIQAGRVWVNNYHSYPAHAPFGGYKKSASAAKTT
jgi:aldehyde dehydrogenase